MPEPAANLRQFRSRLTDPHWRRHIWNYWIVDGFNGGKNYALHYFARAMPIDMCSAFGAMCGALTRRFSRRYAPQRQRVRENWTLLKNDGSDPNAPHALRDSVWTQTGRVALELSILDRLWPAGRIAVEGAEHVASAWATGRPVIVMSIHLAGWETIMPSLIGLGHKVTLIYQPQGNRFEHQILRMSRQRCGVTLAPPWRAGALPAVRALKSRESLLIVYVDEFTNGRVQAPTFGRPLKIQGNIANVARMAALTNAIVIPARGLRVQGAWFKVQYSPPLNLVNTGDMAGDLAANVAMIDAMIEPVIRDNLEKWYMLFDFRVNT